MIFPPALRRLLDGTPYEVIHARRVVDEVAPAVLAQDECDGSGTCPASIHILGCYRSTVADVRREHEDRLRRAGGEGL